MSDKATIKASDDGPLIVKGSFTVLDGEGTPYSIDRAVVALCRCGHSQSKPFCDGSHTRIGFRDNPRVDAESTPQRNGDARASTAPAHAAEGR